MGKAYALLRAGFPYVKTLGMRRMTSNPIDLALGREGRLYILCRGALATEIRRYTWDDEDLGTIGGPGTTDGKFLWPGAILADEAENLYVSDEGCHSISLFSCDGTFIGKWGEQGSGPGQLNRPSGLAFDPEGNIYVVDTMNHRVQKFTRHGQFLLQWGKGGTGPGEFNMPWGIAVDDDGEVYVADWRNDRIQKFTSDGQFVASFGQSGQGEGQFHRPSSIAVDSEGYIYVADWGNERVQILGPDGSFQLLLRGQATLSKWAEEYFAVNPEEWQTRVISTLLPPLPPHLNTPYHISSQTEPYFWGPVSVTLDRENRLYVPETNRHRVQIYQKT